MPPAIAGRSSRSTLLYPVAKPASVTRREPLLFHTLPCRTSMPLAGQPLLPTMPLTWAITAVGPSMPVRQEIYTGSETAETGTTATTGRSAVAGRPRAVHPPRWIMFFLMPTPTQSRRKQPVSIFLQRFTGI